MGLRADKNTPPSACGTQLPLALEPPVGKTFNHFIARGNDIAVRHLKRLCEGGDSVNHQLYLWGGEAVGKSHLLQAACRAVTERGGRSAWLPLAELCASDSDLLSGLETLDCIGIDELDAVKGNDDWQHALFKLINAAHASGCRLVIAGRQNPATAEFELQDLSSRLVWGAVYRLAALDDADKMRVLQRIAKHLGGELTSDASAYLLKHYPRNLKDLIARVEALAHVAKSRKSRVTVSLIKQTL